MLAKSSMESCRGNLIASVVILGIAAQCVFSLLCSALSKSLSDHSEKTKFDNILAQRAMKPKMYWFLDKIQKLQ